MHLSYPVARILCFSHPKFPWGSPQGVAVIWWLLDRKYALNWLTELRSQVFFSFLSALRLTSSHWIAGIDACDILVYWYGRKYPTSHYDFQMEWRGWKYLRQSKPYLHLIFFHWNTLCYAENLNELWRFYTNNQVTDHSIQFLKNICSTIKRVKTEKQRKNIRKLYKSTKKPYVPDMMWWDSLSRMTLHFHHILS